MLDLAVVVVVGDALELYSTAILDSGCDNAMKVVGADDYSGGRWTKLTVFGNSHDMVCM